MPAKRRGHRRIAEQTRRTLRRARRAVSMLRQMSALAWLAQPTCFASVIALQVLQSLLPLMTAWLAKLLFDLLAQSLRGEAPPSLIQHLVVLLTLQALVMLLGQMLSPVTRYLSAELTRRLTLQMKRTLYQKINDLTGLAPFEDPNFHDTIQMVGANTQFGPMQALTIFSTMVQSTLTLLSFLGVLLAFSPWLTGMIALAMLPQGYIQLRLSKQHSGVVLMNSPRERRAAYYGQVLSMAQFAKELRLFNLGAYFLHKFLSTTREIHQTQRAQQRRELRWHLVLGVCATAVSTTAFLVVVVQAFLGHLSLGDVALYTGAVGSVQAALSGLVLACSQANDSVLFFSRYSALLSLEQPLEQHASSGQAPALTSGITLRDVSFRYSEQHPWILRHVDLFLPAQQCLALVGLNGAGKTTLVKLLTRLYDPTEGQILWDGIDLREFDPHELRRHLGTVFQDFARYDLSAQDNIGLGNVERIEELSAIQQAAMQAGIHQRIESLPRRYGSILSRWLAHDDEGVELSGGEWQKVALARLFLRSPEMLILDEPTAALDAEAEYALYQHLRGLMHGHTCLLITHRFSTVQMADRIAVLADGAIKEYGSHQELLAQDGEYARLYQMQAAHYQHSDPLGRAREGAEGLLADR